MVIYFEATCRKVLPNEMTAIKVPSLNHVIGTFPADQKRVSISILKKTRTKLDAFES